MSVVKVLGLLATCVALVASLTKVDLPTEGTGDLPKTLKTLLTTKKKVPNKGCISGKKGKGKTMLEMFR